MMTPHNSSLAYESLPTEEGGAPRSSSYREPEFSPSVSHHPIPSPGASYRKGKLITGVLVTLLLLASVILGLIIAISARKDAYRKVFGPDLDVNFIEGKNDFSGHWDQNTADSNEYSQATSDHSGNGEVGEQAAGQEALQPLIPTTMSLPPPTTTTTITTTTTTTTTTTPKPTTTTTTTTPIPTTTTTTSTTTTPLTTTPQRTEPPTTIAAKPASAGPGDEHPSFKNDTDDDYDSDLRAVDYMVMLQKKMSPGVAVAVLVVLVLGCVAAVVAIMWLIRRRSTANRRRAHVRRAINELRDQGKAGLLQSDDEA